MQRDDETTVTTATVPFRPNPDLVDNLESRRLRDHDREKVRQIRELGYIPDDPKWLLS